jgi:hypothetical protein
MRLDGSWHFCRDGVLRPVLVGGVQSADATWVEVPFLLDTGADRTVLSGDVFVDLRLVPVPGTTGLGGVGGVVDGVVVDTHIRFSQAGERWAVFAGQFAALPDPDALDMSVLGRDILNLFAVIVDRPGDVVCLLGQRHTYRIQPNDAGG